MMKIMNEILPEENKLLVNTEAARNMIGDLGFYRMSKKNSKV